MRVMERGNSLRIIWVKKVMKIFFNIIVEVFRLRPGPKQEKGHLLIQGHKKLIRLRISWHRVHKKLSLLLRWRGSSLSIIWVNK